MSETIVKSEYKCHLCGEPFSIIPPEISRHKGVTVKCMNETGCLEHENVFGCGDNEKAAVEIAKQKYKK
jgi:hypothetical protein